MSIISEGFLCFSALSRVWLVNQKLELLVTFVSYITYHSVCYYYIGQLVKTPVYSTISWANQRCKKCFVSTLLFILHCLDTISWETGTASGL